MLSTEQALSELESLRSRITILSEREDLLARIDQATRILTTPEDMLLAAATLLGQYLRVNRCAYADVEADQDTFNLTGNYIDGTHSIVGRYTFTQFSTACLRQMRSGEPFIVEDSETDSQILNDEPSVLEVFRGTAIRAVICVPVLKDGVFSASMAVHCITPRHWLTEEVDLVRAVASRCWESIERSRVLRNLQDSQARLRLALEAGRSGTFDWFIPENRVYWSPELEKLYGVPEGTFEGSLSDWSKRVHPDDSRRILSEIEIVLAQQRRDYGYDFRVVLANGEERWLHGQAHFLYAPDGTARRMIGINVDIHERRTAEETLIRTEKLTAVGRLAASIAHEINNPLESITNLIYLARLTDDRAETDAYLEQVDLELRRVSQITSQTLRFYRQSTRPTQVTPDSLLKSVLAIHQGRLKNSFIQVRQLFRSTDHILCFENEIRQVLSNLISNAIDAMPSGGELFLRTHPSVDSSGTPGVVISVADTGMGISNDTKRRLFEPFFTTKGFNGTGLGLWVSHEIITRHRGRMRVRSCQQRTRGTVFSIFLPLENEKNLLPANA